MSYKRSRAAFEEDLQKQQSPYVTYGTPLPPLDPDVRDDGSYVPVWKQEVTDERGRKRLHGAFTGGFSAGYFNTVGSKEGWTPSTFVSSRSKRAGDQKPTRQKAEDFMDEEDLADAEEARQLQTSSAFSGLGTTEDDGRRRDAFMDLVRPTGSTMGAKLLQKMGWRQGQGVGPKVRRKARVDDMDAKGNDDSETRLFAPENTQMISFVKKNDHKGLGYTGEARLESDPSNRKTQNEQYEQDDFSILSRSKQKTATAAKAPKRGAFGVGVLNDTGSDDEDPYEMGPKISYNRVIGKDKRLKKITASKIGASSGSANPLLSVKPVFMSKKASSGKSSSGFRKCHDGRLPLDGFVLSVKPVTPPVNLYAPPKIPEGWSSAKKSSTTAPAANNYQSSTEAAKASALDPSARGSLLGEAALPGKSVFDFLTPAARERLATATGKSNLPAALSEAPPPGFEKSAVEKEKDLWSAIPQLDKDTAAAALSRGFMPYADDEAKRARYRAFLELKSGRRNILPERKQRTSHTDWVKELEEFAHAARVFKPISGMMASRFTSSSSSRVFEGGSGETPGSDADLISKPKEKPKDPAEEAAKLGMFGPMTRSVIDFFPTRLVCKRFNVKPPTHVHVDPGSAGPGEAETKVQEPVSKAVMEEMLRDASWNRGGFVSGGTEGGATQGDDSSENRPVVKLEEPPVVDVERNEALEGDRPGEAVFKAIFGSDDEDDE